MAKEKLPAGFERLPSLTIRVRIRRKGEVPISRVFLLAADTQDDRRRQLQAAKAWAEETRRRMDTGVHVNTHAAERLTLEEALLRYSREGLKGKPGNVVKDRNRIRTILSDPIAKRSVAALRKVDIAAYRDRLGHTGWLANVNSAINRLGAAPANRSRINSLRELIKLRERIDSVSDATERARIELSISQIESKEGIIRPARTTISNKVQLISRALKFVGETMEGVPDVSGVAMPAASAARDRRLLPGELDRLLAEAAKQNPILPTVIKFAIETCLRRERILEFSLSHIKEIGGGKQAIVFPKTQERRKRTGVIPITTTINALIADAVSRGAKEKDPAIPLFKINGTTFDHQWRRAVVAAGIDDFRFHDLRHEGTSFLFERGLSTAEVMSITGHSTTDMVDRYSHYSAALVHSKLEKGLDQDSLFAEIDFLIQQFKSLGGDSAKVARLL
jgi:integrase